MNSDSPAATILVPVHDHGPLLYCSLKSALKQTVPVEVFVVGDGATAETKAVVREIAADDARVRFFDHRKGPRHGEAYRHEALHEALKVARGRIVCYLSDDDLYLPDHVEQMVRLLEDADFAHALAVRVQPDGDKPDGDKEVHPQELREGRDRIPLSAGAHTLESYRNLPEGWTAPPPGVPADLYMWQKFLRADGLRFRAGKRPTVLVFHDSHRQQMTLQERAAEMRRWEKVPCEQITALAAAQTAAFYGNVYGGA
jgi:GalNAc5-diNAcBac-PP-undecaprenol beta-1,3-glucosyltransferase